MPTVTSAAWGLGGPLPPPPPCSSAGSPFLGKVRPAARGVPGVWLWSRGFCPELPSSLHTHRDRHWSKGLWLLRGFLPVTASPPHSPRSEKPLCARGRPVDASDVLSFVHLLWPHCPYCPADFVPRVSRSLLVQASGLAAPLVDVPPRVFPRCLPRAGPSSLRPQTGLSMSYVKPSPASPPPRPATAWNGRPPALPAGGRTGRQELVLIGRGL